MGKKILAFGASNSRNSINKKLANYTANKVPNAEIILLDLNDFEMPIYSIDREIENGIHPLVIQFKEAIENSDAIVISFAEHNGAYSTAFKNIFDWLSRTGDNIWANKPMFLLATSPGGRGGLGVLEIASNTLRRINTNKIVSFSLPSFHRIFSEEAGITDPELKAKFNQNLQEFIENIA